MRKYYYFIGIICMLICSSITQVHSNDSFASLVGQSFEYDVITSLIDLSIDNEHEFYIETFRVGDQAYTTNKTILVEPVSFDNDKLNCSFTCESSTAYKQYFYSTSDFESFYFDYLTRPMYIFNEFDQAITNHTQLSILNKGHVFPDYRILFFLPNTSTTWDEMNSTSQHQKEYPYPSDYPIDTSIYRQLKLESNYSEHNGQASIESYIFTKMKSISINGILNSAYKATFNMSNGVLLGYRTIGYYSGELFGANVECNIELHIELVDYNLTSMSLYTPYDKSNRILYASIFLGGLAIAVTIPVTVVLIKRRRKN